MGCLQSGPKSYFETDNSEERSIRKWEKDIGSFTVDFNMIHQKLSYSNDAYNSAVVKRISDQFFNQSFFKVIDKNSFFLKDSDESCLNSNKILSLFFLLSTPGLVSSKYNSYSDKAYYLYLKSRENAEDDLDEALTKGEKLREFIKVLTEVSCIGFAGAYYKNQGNGERGLIIEAKKGVDGMVDYIVDCIFTINGSKVDVLSFKDLKNKFSNDLYFLSSGYIREKASEFLNKQEKK